MHPPGPGSGTGSAGNRTGIHDAVLFPGSHIAEPTETLVRLTFPGPSSKISHLSRVLERGWFGASQSRPPPPDGPQWARGQGALNLASELA